MSYQVLARKWRPKTFREMAGQEHVLKALINALDHDRLHHAYLFTGTRGVGKTTIARILAKCLNCEVGVSSEPCGTCNACTSINEGRFVDLIEMDAASRSKVDEMREMLDNVQYTPTAGRYKVYLIDEVHMLSGHSFNALLKTLEEPPPHVKFLLATTDPQKIPATILSRCLQFSLKNMSPERVVKHLDHVLQQEMVSFEEPALWLLGRAAAGSMRDALSLTDQAIAFGSGKLLEDDVRQMLGTIDHSAVYQLLEALISGDGEAVLAEVARMAEHAVDFAAVLEALLNALHRLSLAQVVPAAVDNSEGDRQQLLALAQRLSGEDLQLYYQIALHGKRDLPYALDARSGLEMALLRMLAFRPLRDGEILLAAEAADSAKKPRSLAEPSVGDAGEPAAEFASPATTVLAEAAPTPESKSELASVPGQSQAGQSEAPALAEQASTKSAGSDVALNSSTPTPSRQAPQRPQDTPQHIASASPEPHQAASSERPSAYAVDEEYAAMAAEQGGRSPSAAADALAALSEQTSELDRLLADRPETAVSTEQHNEQGSAVEQAAEHGDDKPQDRGSHQEPLERATGPQTQLTSQPSNLAAGSPIEPSETSAAVSNRDAEASAQSGQSLADRLMAAASVPPEQAAVEASVAKSKPRSAAAGVESREKIPLSGLNSQSWRERFREFELPGILGNIASQCHLQALEGDCLQLQLSPTNATLLNERYVERLGQSLSEYFSTALRIQVEVKEVEAETPLQYLQRLREEQMLELKLALRDDPALRLLIEQFGAELDDSSIEPLLAV